MRSIPCSAALLLSLLAACTTTSSSDDDDDSSPRRASSSGGRSSSGGTVSGTTSGAISGNPIGSSGEGPGSSGATSQANPSSRAGTPSSGGGSSRAGTSSSRPASSGGGGGSSSAAAGCGDVTVEGECLDNSVRYCSPQTDQVVEYSCDTFFGAGTASTCTEISAEYGVDCAVANGVDCVYTTTADELYVAFCQDSTAGCLLVPGTADAGVTATCTANQGDCTPAPEGQDFVPTCTTDNTRTIIACRFGQPVTEQCLGGTCTDGNCVGTAGAPCSTAEGSVLLCGAGLTCVQPDGGLGVCQ